MRFFGRRPGHSGAVASDGPSVKHGPGLFLRGARQTRWLTGVALAGGIGAISILRAADSAATPSVAAAPVAAVYAVNLSPGWAVGQKFGLVSDYTQNTTVTNMDAAQARSGPLPNQVQSQVRHLHMEAEGQVLAVSADGLPQKLGLTLKNIVATIDGQGFQGLPAAGAKIVATQAGPDATTATIDGLPASQEVAYMLHLAVWTELGKHRDQEKYGPSGPMAVGVAWPVNAAACRDEINAELPGVANVQGMMHLDRVSGAGAGEIQSVSGQVTFTDAHPPLPPGFIGAPANFAIELSGLYPAGTTQGVLAEGRTTLLKYGGWSPSSAGASKTFLETMVRQLTQTFTFE